MKILLDTNVLVAAVVEEHSDHLRAWPWLERIAEGELEGYVSLHTLAEAYSVLTNLPMIPKISPAQAQALLEDALRFLHAVALAADDYGTAITRMARLNLPGGGIYDALHAQAALKAEVNILLTLNPRHSPASARTSPRSWGYLRCRA